MGCLELLSSPYPRRTLSSASLVECGSEYEHIHVRHTSPAGVGLGG